MREPLERHARAMQRFADVSGLKRMAEGFTQMARGGAEAFSSLIRLVPVVGQLAAGFLAAGLALNKLAERWANWANPLVRDADRIGTTAQQLSVLQDATRAAGGSVDDVTESLKGLTDTATQARLGLNAQALAQFSRAGAVLGRDILTLNGHLRATTEILPDVLQYLDSIKDPASRMTAAINFGSAALFNQVETVRRAQRAGETFAQTYDRLNAAAAKRQQISKADEQTLQAYNEAVGELTNALQHLEHQAGAAAARGVTPLLRATTEFIDAIPGFTAKIAQAASEIGTGFANAFKAAAKSVADFWGQIAPFRARIDAWIDRLGQLGKTPTAPPGTVNVPGYGNLPTPAAPGVVVPGYGQVAPTPAPAPGAPPTVNVPGYGIVPNVPGPMRPGSTPAPAPAPGAPAASPAAAPRVTPMSGDHAEFIRRAWPLALEASKRTGVDARVILAQAALESHWGKSAPGNNYFGIKGPGGSYATQEFENGRFVTKQQSFAGYGSIEESFKGYADFINKNPRYAALKTAQGLDAQIAALQASGYATDPAYGRKIAALANRFNLAPPATAVAQAAPAPPVDLGQYRSGLAAPQATGAPAQVTGGAPVSGSVDVTITHRNPPPSDTLAANATGDVNLAPPRTERQLLAAA